MIFSISHSFVLVIQARMNSSRLPGKILKDFHGKPLLEYLIARLQKKFLYPIVVATTDTTVDDVTVDICRSLKIETVRGSETDVFSRFKKVAELFPKASLVRLTADNPLVDLRVIEACIQSHQKSDADFTSTREFLENGHLQRYIPKGHSVDIFHAQALLTLESLELSEFEKEHVIPVFFRKKNIYKLNILRDWDFQLDEASIDTAEDFDRVVKLFVEENP